MAGFIKHEECSKCGSSDGKAVYSDGSTYCFVCQAATLSDEYKEILAESKSGSQRKKRREAMKQDTEVEVQKSTKPALTTEEAAEIKSETSTKANNFRSLTDATLAYFGVRHSFDEETGEVLEQYYPCTQEGQLVGYKIREVPKNFRSIGRTGADCELFGQFRFNRGGKYVVITEGEVDQLSAYQMLKEYNVSKGWDFETAVVSPTTGAQSKKQIKAQYKFLDSFDNIILCYDADKAGQEAIEALIPSLPKGKVKIMKMRFKDANEYLKAGKSKEFISDFFNAEKRVPVGVLPSSDLYARILEQAEVPKIPFPPEMEELNNKFVGGLPVGAIINVAADTGLGKTTLVNFMLEYWVFNSPHMLGIVSMELDAGQYGEAMLSQYLQRKLALIGSTEERIKYLSSDYVKKKAEELFKKEDGEPRFYLLDNRDGSVEEIQDTIEELVVACGCKVIILDVLQDVLDGLSNEEQALFLKWAKGIIKSHGCTLVFVNHMRKVEAGKSGADSEMNIMGSSTIIKSASANILLKRDKMAEDPIKRNTTEIFVTKNRLYGLTGPAGALYYDNEKARLFNLDTWLRDNGVGEF